MYLKKLEIHGFKSFAQKTVLEFLPPKNSIFSITAVVGPNGSGKSNVVDAIRWVMGEQSMKTIRSKKSEDVIFNGSEAKGALSAAEVTMVLDNTVGRIAELGELSLDGAEEITITRRLYRSGESEYLVNNNAVRLLDVHLLLAKAQFAEHAYSIVSQGTIDRLLTVSPAERKDFFDEASGIKEFQIKRHQAELKLARSVEHITQAEVLLKEIEPRVKLLARQVKKLEERQEITVRLTSAQERLYTTLFLGNKVEADQVAAEVAAIDETYRQRFSELEIVQTELAELARSASRQEVFMELQTRHQEAVRVCNEGERRLAIIDGQRRVEYSLAGQQNVGWLEEKIGELKNNQERFQEQLLKVEADTKAAEKTVRDYQQRLQALLDEKTKYSLEIARLQNQLLRDQSEQNYRDFSGLTAVKAVIDAKHRFQGSVHGVVAELGEVREEYRLALEVAAGQHLSSVVVEHEGVARLAIQFLRENRLGIVTFLPLTKIQGRFMSADERMLAQADGVCGRALDLISFDPLFEPIFSFILGSTLVVHDIEAAERLGVGRIRMVTLLGDVIEKTGVMRGGFRHKKNQLGFSALALGPADRLEEYRGEIRLAEQRIKEVDQELSLVNGQLLSSQVDLESQHQRAAFVSEQKNAVEGECARLEQELAMVTGNPADRALQFQKLAEEKEVLQEEIIVRQAQVAAVAAEIENFNRQEEEKKQRIFGLQEEMQTRQATLNGIIAERNERKIALAKIETRREDLVKEIYAELAVSAEVLLARVVITEEVDVEVLHNEIQKLKYQLSLIGGIEEGVLEEYRVAKERFDFLSGQVADLTKAVDDLHKLTAELDEIMKKRRSAAFKKIRKEFDRYFKILFDGGQADLEEVYGNPAEKESEASEEGVVLADSSPEDTTPQKSQKAEQVLVGIEVMANPPGKKIKYLNALSGGERTLTSIALICAILHHNPSPFVILDEVEAALDEANTTRFVRIMSELARESQFIIITHNRVTMHAADALYGVVMKGDGISQLLSVKMEEAVVLNDSAAVDNPPQKVV